MRRNQRGVTIVELIVAVAVLSIVMVGVFSFLLNISGLYSSNNKDLALQNEAQTILAQLDTFLANADAGVFDYEGKTYIASEESVYVIKLDTTDGANRLYLAAYTSADHTLPADYTVISPGLSSDTEVNQAYVSNAKTKLTVEEDDYELFGEYVTGFSVTPYFDEGNNNYVTVNLKLEYPFSDKSYAASKNVFLRNRIVTKAVGSSTTGGSSSSINPGGNTTEDPSVTIKKITALYHGGTKYYGDAVMREDITVTAEYKDGHIEEVTEWTCSNLSQQLEDKAVLYTINYKNFRTGVTVTPIGVNYADAKYSGVIKHAGEMLTHDLIELTVHFNDGFSAVSTNWTSESLGTELTEGWNTVDIVYSGKHYNVGFMVYPSIADCTEAYVSDSDITKSGNNIIIDVTGKKYISLSVGNVSAYQSVTYYLDGAYGGQVQQGGTAGDLYLFITLTDSTSQIRVDTQGRTYKDIILYEQN